MAIRVAHEPSPGSVGMAAFAAGRNKYARRKEQERGAIQKEWRGMVFSQGLANQKYARSVEQANQLRMHQGIMAEDRRVFVAGQNQAQREAQGNRDIKLRAWQANAADDAFDRQQEAEIEREAREEKKLSGQDEQRMAAIDEAIAGLDANPNLTERQKTDARFQLERQRLGIKGHAPLPSEREAMEEQKRLQEEGVAESKRQWELQQQDRDERLATAADTATRNKATALGTLWKDRTESIFNLKNEDAYGKMDPTAQAAAIKAIDDHFDGLKAMITGRNGDIAAQGGGSFSPAEEAVVRAEFQKRGQSDDAIDVMLGLPPEAWKHREGWKKWAEKQVGNESPAAGQSSQPGNQGRPVQQRTVEAARNGDTTAQQALDERGISWRQ